MDATEALLVLCDALAHDPGVSEATRAAAVRAIAAQRQQDADYAGNPLGDAEQ